ncbi:MAG: hypothetical protein K2W95_01290 [Candidatus Obscuribacterales bacterium]|nr:hypothetical protein [Candidatus Obscuribacterales bacterium]
MKTLVFAIVTAASVIMMPEASAFQPGERVKVGTNQTGTVLEDTGKLVKVHIDSSGYSADVGVWYDKEQGTVSSAAGGAVAPAGSNGTSGAPGEAANTTTGANSFKLGQRVRVGAINQSGTVLEESGKLVKVRLDSSSGYSPGVGVWYDKEQHQVSDAAFSATAPPGSDTISSAAPGNGISFGSFGNLGSPGSSPASPKQSPPPQKQTGGNPGHSDAPERGNASQNAPTTSPGAGAPPDGIYQCNKISIRSYIHIGTIEIRGGTYKGFSSEQGSFHPYSMDGSGNIVWTGGLTGLPPGWKLSPAKYVGLDYKGHPLIRVYYTSDRGAAEVIDAVKEK